MSTNKQDKAKHNLLRQIWQLSKTNPRQQIEWLLRSALVAGKQANTETGFVLPTVVMVSLVVVLLTMAILVRAFDRSRNASNTRVNQVVLNAATPALDRAKAKIDALLSDPTLPRATPSDIALNNAFKSNRYNFGDEIRLQLAVDANEDGSIQKQPTTATTLENDETINTAWKFPVDTNNDGKFDSYTLYGIYFRSPTRRSDGKFARARKPLEARTPPMSGGSLGQQCNNTEGTGNLVGDSSWYKTGSKLTKSFYVYTATVPIDTPPTNPTVGVASDYLAYQGNKGFSALEYQQDRSRIPLNNNAVVFQDDLELTPGPAFRLNGRVFTNANLLIGGRDNNIRLYQVSSKNSCFYKEENAKISVGGNVGTGNVNDTTDQRAVDVDLYNGVGNDPGSATIDGSNRSTTSAGGSQVGYNDAAYTKRIALMKQTALSFHPGYSNSTKLISPPPTIASVNAVSQYPAEVKDGFTAKITAPGGSSLNSQNVLAEQIEIYLRDRTRRVPYAEVATPDTNAISPYDSTGTGIDSSVFATGIEPPAAWREPTDANTRLTLTTTNLAQMQPEKQKQLGIERYLGDRINVGNNLPNYWKNSNGRYVTGPFEYQFLIPPLVSSIVKWTEPNTENRYRTTHVAALPDLGILERNGFWEDAAAQQPANTTSSVGGLRVVTGAGIYVDTPDTLPPNRYFSNLAGSLVNASFLRQPQLDAGVTIPPVFTTASITTGNQNIVVWSDSTPMTGGADEIAGANRKGDLQMRATAIYHYKDSSYAGSDYINRTPTACISSYYDPTNSLTARNPVGLPDVSGVISVTQPAVGIGRSNNGVVYTTPYTTDAARIGAVATYRNQLNRQARLIFPNGRIVNEPLRVALQKIDANGTRSLADNSALDTAVCSIKILDGTLSPSSSPVIPHGAIKESSFLDAREAKALDKTPTAGEINPINPTELSSASTDSNYNLAQEQRQPLEIRTTDINIGQLGATTIGNATPNQEYMLPNSGIIYASRDDALPDQSNNSAQRKILSPTDFKLDPTRRPNSIRLINGSNLARTNNYRQEEKGLILATNLPAYIRGNFNLHQQPSSSTSTEEFEERLDSTWSNFYSRNPALNTNFACRTNQPGCGSSGDQWRPATILSDAISLMSGGFVDGFRDWGDYDLNNNAGISATQNNPDTAARKQNGFWDNSFITSALWWNRTNTGGNAFPDQKPAATRYISSYLTNGVTPVQRRVNFSEYVMEICRKIPVSECQPTDWVVGTLASPNATASSATIIGSSAANLLSGTTVRPAINTQDQRYARRVAFQRNTDGTLRLTPIVDNSTSPPTTNSTAIPLGINDAGNVVALPYPNGSAAVVNTNYPAAADNALWFRTTTSTNGNPGDPARISYAANQPLYYLPPNQGGSKLILPDTPDIPGGVPSLNLPTGNQSGSDYTICIGNGNQPGSQAYQPTTPLPASPICPSTTADAINDFLGVGSAYGLLDLTSTSTALPADGGTVNATSYLNVIPIPNSFNNGKTITLNSTNPNAIFVLQGGSGLSFGSNCNDDTGASCGDGVTLVLNNVNPNKVFWAVNGAIKFENVKAPGHQLQGNFIGKGAGSVIGANTNINGGRILGVSNIAQYGNTGITITAITTTDQPSLVPVLQIHSPEGSPSNALTPETTGSITNSWLQQATTNTTFNAAFVSGNSPSRPAEESAGLHNFVRFMQRWNAAVNIGGNFIQLQRSAYSTGPFSPIRGGNITNLSIFGYPLTNYISGGGPGNTLTYYDPPTRQWGFDVALLSQPLDLFAQKFTLPTTTTPDEFFREVGQDDPWIQSLLCAGQLSASGSYIAAIDQRPSSCPVSLGSY